MLSRLKRTNKYRFVIQQSTDQIVAIKIVQLNSLKSKKLQELLFQQIEILKKLNHPSVLKCYEIFTSNRNCYIITELCNQGNLENHLKLKGSFTQNEANPIIKDVYDGLLYLAQNNIVHRDLKSANIFLHNGRAKIADFGFAKQINHNFKDLNIGSPLYMAPEGILHNIYGPKTQVWALGILVYELFHGSSPYIYCKTQEQLRRNVMIPLHWNQLRQDLSQDTKQFILTCLQINQQKRFPIQQLINLNYMKRLHQNQQNQLNNQMNLLNKFDNRGPSQSFHQPTNSLAQNLLRVNNNFREPLALQSRQNSRSRNQRQVVFRSVDTKNTLEYQSPKRPTILGQVNKYNIGNPGRNFIVNPSNQFVPNQFGQNQFANTQFVSNQNDFVVRFPNQNNKNKFPMMQTNQQNSFMPTNNLRPGEPIPNPPFIVEQKTIRPFSSYQSQTLNQGNFDKIGYDSINGFNNLRNPQQNDLNDNIIHNRQNNFPSRQIKRSYLQMNKKDSQKQRNQRQFNISQDKNILFQSKLTFKEAIFFIHHCRLIFKFLCMYKQSAYYQEGIYLKIYRYLMQVLTCLNKQNQNNKILADGQKAGLKIKKLRQVTLEYLAKYKKQGQQNNHHIQPQIIEENTLTEVSNSVGQIYNRLNEDISLISRQSYLNSTEQTFIVMGHLCIVIIASIKEIKNTIFQKNYKKLTQFKHIETVLNTPKQQFTVQSFKGYRDKILNSKPL